MADQNIQQIAFEISYYRKQADELSRQMQFVKATYEETVAGAKALEALKESKSASLYPIGGGAYVQASLSGKTVLVDIGARVVQEKSIDDAITLVTERGDKLDATLQELKQQYDVVSTRLEELNAYADSLQQEKR